MAIRIYKSITPGTRNRSVADFTNLTKKKPEKSLLAKKMSKAGRNNRGVITIRHRGGGHKKRYRIIDFKRNKSEIEAKEAPEFLYRRRHTQLGGTLDGCP